MAVHRGHRKSSLISTRVWLFGATTALALVGVCTSLIGTANAAPTGSGIEIFRAAGAGTGGLHAAVRIDAPDPPAAVQAVQAVDVPPVANVSNCRTAMPSATPVATMTVASISYRCPIFTGGQSTMDAGAATWITDIASDPSLSLQVGGSGTIWLGGHRSSHGGAFAAVPAVADGALIVLTADGGSSTYRVVGRAYVRVVNGLVVDSHGVPTNAATLDALLRTDRGGGGAARLTIQTCDGENYRWMIYADLVTSG